MAKQKHGKSKSKRPAGARPNPLGKTKSNPFETISVKRKFDVVGRRTKGDNKNVARARGEGIIKRKATLLEEFRQSGKANTFVDRRFGEGDEGLTREEKAIARFQKVRTAQMKRSKFNLQEDGPEEELTHLGTSLANIDDFGDGAHSDEDEGNEGKHLDAQMVRDMHFGGGDGDGRENKTKKEAMEELIAKSKYYKTMRRKEKEEDEQKLESLDDTFRELQQNGTLNEALRKMTKEDKKASRSVDEYDKMTRELLFEIRAQPSERTKTPEEVAAIEAKKLEDMEYQRKKRMRSRGGDDESGSDDDDGRAKGGFAARRAKRKKAEDEAENKEDKKDEAGEEEDDEGSEGSEEEGSEEEGSEEEEDEEDDDDMDPLQKKLKEVAKKMHPDLKAGLARMAAIMEKRNKAENGAGMGAVGGDDDGIPVAIDDFVDE
eukprot:CAMPEP_0198224506 /NCGR_PEP_ID=MMETSP1445-20131203/97216_1 /TAXON_ID=36898 /ORGANISM="Pyramimonas sp., Strain CCMP2087" /LENGTH=431 /DNA_ID=CAMNT_0043903709 /DNA_START=127 /DNA_END=1419 /DNA_ORIENTATION=+